MPYRYMILDSRNTAVARGYLESPPDSPVWYIKVLDGAEEKVMEHEYLQLVSMEENAPAKMGRILRCKNNVVVLEPMKDLDEAIQRDLRVEVKFNTFLYPLSGDWKGRRYAISRDLSCGGIAFFCGEPLQEKERLEIVIPITTNPLVLKLQILRRRTSNSEIPLFSAKFIDMVHEEEAAVREAVFGQQIKIQNKNKENFNGTSD